MKRYEIDHIGIYVEQPIEMANWIQKISSYKKLIISWAVIREFFEGAGFEIEFMGVRNGLVTIIGIK